MYIFRGSAYLLYSKTMKQIFELLALFAAPFTHYTYAEASM